VHFNVCLFKLHFWYKNKNPFVNCLFQPLQVNEVKTESINSRIDPKLCPTCPDLLAFVSGLDLWVTCISSGNECRLTHVHKGKSDLMLTVCTCFQKILHRQLFCLHGSSCFFRHF